MTVATAMIANCESCLIINPFDRFVPLWSALGQAPYRAP
jgi:hypothetical protein